MPASNANNDRIDRIEEAILRLTDNQEYMAGTHRIMSENIGTLTQLMSRMDERQAAIEQRMDERQAAIEQRQAESDQRFNILLQEIRQLNRRLDEPESN